MARLYDGNGRIIGEARNENSAEVDRLIEECVIERASNVWELNRVARIERFIAVDMKWSADMQTLNQHPPVPPKAQRYENPTWDD